MGAHALEVEEYNGVSTADVPSAAWGWSELPRRGIIISGVIAGLFLLGMLFGNHRGNVENIWLVGFAAAVLIGTLIWAVRPQGKQVERLTAHNKPVGHIEPNWTEDQLNMTGAYADLTDDQLRAWNHDPQAGNARL